MASANKDNPELRRCGGKARGAHRRNDWPEEEIPMADDFSEHDLDTPTEADLDLAYGSKSLSVPDIGTRKVRTKIIKVRKAKVRGNDGTERTRFVLFFESLDKGLVLNAVNKDRLVAALGRVPAKWENASVGIYVDPDVVFGGKKTGGIRLRVLEAFQAKPAPKPAPKRTAAPEWPEQPDDPGHDPDLNDNPDFTQAAE
jgi:hypothetical protein